jgi:hypothetical protein
MPQSITRVRSLLVESCSNLVRLCLGVAFACSRFRLLALVEEVVSAIGNFFGGGAVMADIK